MKSFLAWLCLAVVLINCSLVVTPTYLRPAPVAPSPTDGSTSADIVYADNVPTEDIPTDDVPSVMSDADVVQVDVPSDQPSPELPPRCVPGATEVCNGIDDDCDGVVDDLPAAPLVRCVTDDGRLGRRGVNCTCAAELLPGEICYNGVDDDNNPATPDDCVCAVYYSSQQFPGIPTQTTWTEALRLANLRPPAERVICLLTPPVIMGVTCMQNWPIREDISIPADVQVLGGYRLVAVGSVARDVANCRPTLTGAVRFANGSTLLSSLNGVAVSPLNTSQQFSVEMPESGNLFDVNVFHEGGSGSESVGIGNNSNMIGARMLRSVNVRVLRASRNATAIRFNGGNLFASQMTLETRTTSSDAESRAIHLIQSQGVFINQASIAGISGGARAIGVQLVAPQGAVVLQAMESLTAATTNTISMGKVGGVVMDCSGRVVDVSVRDLNWFGGFANTDGGVALGIENNGCALAVSSSTSLMVNRRGIRGGAGPGIGGQVAQTALGVLCRGNGSCDFSGVVIRAVGETAPRGSVLNATALAVEGSMRVSLSDVKIDVGATTNNAVSGRALGVEAGTSAFYAERSYVQPATSTQGPNFQVAINWNGGERFVIRDSVVTIQDGIGVRIAAGGLRPGTLGVVLASNTFYRSSQESQPMTLVQVEVLGSTPAMAEFRVVNNIFSPATGLAQALGRMNAIAFRTTNHSVFTTFTHNLVSEASVIAVVNGLAFFDAVLAQLALGPVGILRNPPTVGFLAPGDFHIAPVGSDARNNGYLPATLGRRDIDGEPRPRPLLGSDIGADEID